MCAQWRNDERVRLLKELTEISSCSGDAAGVNAVQDVVARELRKLGFDVGFERHPAGDPSVGKVVVGILGGTPGAGPFVDLVTHADTVYERSSPFSGFTLDEKQEIARGPGVIDDKGGIVVALEGVRRFLGKGGKLGLRFVCAPTEELGSPGFGDFFAGLSRVSRMVLGFEPSLEDGSIIQSRRGNLWYHIRVDGREGHAGRDHRRGVNAAHELAFKLVELHRMTDYAKDLTVSTGQISGGSKFNVICGHAEAKVDVRFSDFATRAEARRRVEEIIAASHLSSSEDGKAPVSSFELANDCPPFAETKESAPFVSKYLSLIQEIEGTRVSATKSGGAADSNYMSREGLVVLDGLGASGGNIHSEKEFIRLSSLETRPECLAHFLAFVESSGN